MIRFNALEGYYVYNNNNNNVNNNKWYASCNNDNNSNDNNNNGHWGRTIIGFSLPREFGLSCPPGSRVAPLAIASNPKATPVRVTTMGWWDSLVLAGSLPRRWKTPNLNPVRWGLVSLGWQCT